MFEKYKSHSKFSEPNLYFNIDWFKTFDRTSFKINHEDTTNGSTKKHQEAFLEMGDYFKNFLKDHLHDTNNYKKNKAIYGTFCSYFRAFVPYKENKKYHLSFVVRKEFLAIEAGFQLKDLQDEDMLKLNEIILDVIEKEELEFLSDFGFDLLYTRLGKKDIEVPLSEVNSFFNNRTLNDGVLQFRWKALREDFEKNTSRISSEVSYIVGEIGYFFDSVKERMPNITISGNEHMFQSKTIPASTLDKNLSLDLIEFEKNYGDLEEWDGYKIFPDFVNSLKTRLIEFVEAGMEYAYIDPEDTNDIELEWPMGENIDVPPIKEVSCEFLSEEKESNISFVLYRYMKHGNHTFRLNSFTSPITMKTLTHEDVNEADVYWGFINSLLQDDQELECINSESGASWDDLGDRLLVFMGHDLVYGGVVPGECSFEEYSEWDDDTKARFDELTDEVTECLMERCLEFYDTATI